MKTKPIPESWHVFHRLVIVHSHDPAWSLTGCVEESNCSARMPRIYKALGWIKPKREPNQWNLNVPSIGLTQEMAEQIRAESKRMENASDPLGLKIKTWKKGIATISDSISDELMAKMPTLEETKEKIMEKRAEELKKFWDADLVSELRRRGYEVTAKKTVEL